MAARKNKSPSTKHGGAVSQISSFVHKEEEKKRQKAYDKVKLKETHLEMFTDAAKGLVRAAAAAQEEVTTEPDRKPAAHTFYSFLIQTHIDGTTRLQYFPCLLFSMAESYIDWNDRCQMQCRNIAQSSRR